MATDATPKQGIKMAPRKQPRRFNIDQTAISSKTVRIGSSGIKHKEDQKREEADRLLFGIRTDVLGCVIPYPSSQEELASCREDLDEWMRPVRSSKCACIHQNSDESRSN